jgi:hypothetical protein
MVKPKSIRPPRAELQDVIAGLRALQSTLAVAIGALRHQNADIDADIANLLQRSVSNPLEGHVQKLEVMLSRLPRPASSTR